MSSYDFKIGKTSSLAEIFYFQARCNPQLIALVINGRAYTYAEMLPKVCAMAALIKDRQYQRIGIDANRSLSAYVTVLAVHWLGLSYVPICQFWPEVRLHDIIANAEIDAIVVDDPLAFAFTKITLLAGDPLKTILDTQTLGEDLLPHHIQDHQTAYIIYTSGSTGKPKGVGVTFGNLTNFMRAIAASYPLEKEDRVSQHSSLTFDVSIFDMCLAWMHGAALYVVPEAVLMAPLQFIIKHAITVWLSVPAIIYFMQKMHMLKPGILPSLRHSLFTGEVLTRQHVEAWHQAAPESTIDNLYGPTESTIDCLRYPIHPNQTLPEKIPIGVPLLGVEAALVDAKHTFLSKESEGELVISGKQIANGYWRNEEQTTKRFVMLLHPQLGLTRWYKTGDFCYQDREGIFHYLYRLDNQIKILGKRVELEEVEQHLKQLTNYPEWVVLAITLKAHEELELIAVTTEANLATGDIKTKLKTTLPHYMIPSQFIHIDALPYNTNGKMDRKQLAKLIEGKL